MIYIKYKTHPKEQTERNQFIKELYETGKFSYQTIAGIVNTKFGQSITRQRVKQICDKHIKN